MTDLQKLEWMLRPPGKGVYTVSTGAGLASSIWKKIYKTTDFQKVTDGWKESLSKIKSSKIALIGVPSDVGAGIVRGANMGPIGLREFLYQDNSFKKWIKADVVTDVGDIIVIPQLLHDEMLNETQLERSRKMLYGGDSSARGRLPDERLPVSPLSILKEVTDLLFKLNPKIRILALGGDHSISWPLIESYAKQVGPFAILHFDAHTDLLESRLGIDYCFGTWAHHANRVIGGNGRLVQVGIRVSSKPKAHWEKKEGVKQFWADEILKNPKKAMADILEHLHSLNLKNIYISNDIDGTDMKYAAATGTPEGKGLTPAFISKLIEEVGMQFRVIGGDLVEVAPVLCLNQRGEPDKTLLVARSYLLKMIEAM
ncbi:MAG: arginase family protein [Deltaproteobacteria bacterium]